MIYFHYQHQSLIIDISNAVQKLFNDKHISSDVKICVYLGKRKTFLLPFYCIYRLCKKKECSSIHYNGLQLCDCILGICQIFSNRNAPYRNTGRIYLILDILGMFKRIYYRMLQVWVQYQIFYQTDCWGSTNDLNSINIQICI